MMNDLSPLRSLLIVLVLALGSQFTHAQVVGWQSANSSVGEGGTINLTLTRTSTSASDTVVISISDEITVDSFSDAVIFSIGQSTAICQVVTNDDNLCDGIEGKNVVFTIESVSAGTIDTDFTTDTLNIQDNDAATAVIGTTGSPVCGMETIDLVADSIAPDWVGTWSVAPGTGSFLNLNQASTTFTPSTYGPDTLRWIIENNGCRDSAAVVVNFVEQQVANAGNDQIICRNDSTVLLSGNSPLGWSGIWSAPEGSDIFSDSSLFSSTFFYSGSDPSITLTWTLSDSLNTCETSSDPIQVSFVQPPVSVITADPDVRLCEADPYTLHGNAVISPYSGAWSISGGGSPNWFSALADSNAVFTPIDAGNFTVTWTVSNSTGPCPLATASLLINVIHRPFAGIDDTLLVCSVGVPVQLLGLLGPGVDTVGTWTNSMGQLPNGTYNPVLMAPGTYTYTVTGDPPCPSDASLIQVTEVIAPDTLGPGDIFSLDGDTFCMGQYTRLAVVEPMNGVQYSWSCSGCIEPDTVNGSSVEFQWGNVPGQGSYSVSAHIGSCSSLSELFPVTLLNSIASCPQGIVFFEPHGLAVLDPLADQFQWGSISEAGAFVAMVGATQQTIFDPANINGCLPYYAVRTRQGSGCWTTTTTCVDSTHHECSTSGMIVDQEEIQVGVSPNPVNDGSIRVLLSGVTLDEPITVELFSANGQLAYRKGYVAAAQLVIDPGTLVLPPGLYLLRVNGTDWVKTTKVSIN